MNQNFKKHLLKITKATNAEEFELIQSLWSNYGRIVRIKLFDSRFKTLVVKHISLQKNNSHPKDWNTNKSHMRKVKSYEVEINWYQSWSTKCDQSCRIPKYMSSFEEGKNQWIILEDLATNYPQLKSTLKLNEVKVCLNWLANFHARFLNQKPVGLWEIGTYWNLETRPDEFEQLEDVALKTHAYQINDILNKAQFKTIVHGDAKLSNFCFSSDSTRVAAVDFQYVGAGCGIKDVAYFLGSCLSSSALEDYESELLEYYFNALKVSLTKFSPKLDFVALKKEWSYLYAFAFANFTRFMLGWMPSHKKINPYSLKKLKLVLNILDS